MDPAKLGFAVLAGVVQFVRALQGKVTPEELADNAMDAIKTNERDMQDAIDADHAAFNASGR